MRRQFFVLFVVLVFLTSSTGTAAATGDPQVGNDVAYAGPGSQYGRWNVNTRNIRMVVRPDTNMNTDYCMDVYLDWRNLSGHYDGRFVRSCRPGTLEETDPGGDGQWIEPTNYSNQNVTGMSRGWGYTHTDFDPYSTESLADSGGGSILDEAPRTGTDGWAWIRTRYQDNSLKYCNPLPVWKFQFTECS